MTKSDLKTGMVVETRVGEKYLVMRDPDCADYDLINLEKSSEMPLCHYTDTLEHKGIEELDITAVYSLGAHISSLFDVRFKINTKDDERFTLLWKREEKIKEMTIAEIEKELGCKIKIVGEDNA